MGFEKDSASHKSKRDQQFKPRYDTYRHKAAFLERCVAHGAAGRAGLEFNVVRRGSVNTDVLPPSLPIPVHSGRLA